MKKSISTVIFFYFIILFLPSSTWALDFEFAVGAWHQSIEGDISYKRTSTRDIIDFSDDLDYDDETRLFGRMKIGLPVFLPNVYLMGTPMEFDGIGEKSFDFTFGDFEFRENVDYYSKLTMDHLDLALYYGIPLIKKATLDKFNIDIGINVRVFDIEAKLRQDTIGLKESKDYTLYVPMVYIGAQLRPVDILSIEAEARGVSYSDNRVYSLTGRLKLIVYGPIFIAGGYRYDKITLDEKHVELTTKIKGPFLEAGFEF